MTHAALLHQLAAGEAGQLAEAIGAVDDGEDGLDLRVSKNEVTVWVDGRKQKQHTEKEKKTVSGTTGFVFLLLLLSLHT